jgi:hypothetical protein
MKITKKLLIEIKKEDLSIINDSGLNIILIKETNSSEKYICWNSYKPFQNQMFSWEDDYYLYTSLNKVKNRNRINILSRIKCTPGVTYCFQNNIFEVINNESNNQSHIRVINNNNQPYLTFGLGQMLNYNGDKGLILPINASMIPNKFQANFQDSGHVYILLASDITKSQVFESFKANAYLIPLLLHNDFLKNKHSSRRYFLSLLALGSFLIMDQVHGRVIGPISRLDFNNKNLIKLHYHSKIGTFVPV